MNGIENPGVLDAFAHDTRTDRLVLAMYERRSWGGDPQQLHQLQEKLNAYLSFLLDGEMAEAFPQLVGKAVDLQLRTVHEPDEQASDLIRRIREQLEFQGITFEVVQVAEEEISVPESDGDGGCCGGGCGCS